MIIATKNEYELKDNETMINLAYHCCLYLSFANCRSRWNLCPNPAELVTQRLNKSLWSKRNRGVQTVHAYTIRHRIFLGLCNPFWNSLFVRLHLYNVKEDKWLFNPLLRLDNHRKRRAFIGNIKCARIDIRLALCLAVIKYSCTNK